MLNNLRPRVRPRRRLLRAQRVRPRRPFLELSRAPRRRWRLGALALALSCLPLGAWLFARSGSTTDIGARTAVRGATAPEHATPANEVAETPLQGALSASGLSPTQPVAERSPLRAPSIETDVPLGVLTRLPAARRDLDRLRDPETRLAFPIGAPLSEWVRLDGTPASADEDRAGAFRVHYTLHPELSHDVLQLLERQKVALGQVLVADAGSGRLLAYALTNPERFGPNRTYPAASLAKVVTAAAVLEAEPEAFGGNCVFTGSPYRLTRARLEPPRRGNQVSLIKALATSNNQCFGRLAAHTLGSDRMQSAFSSFGWLASPAPGYPAGEIESVEDDYALAQLGSGLAGSSITPLHAIELALSLVSGQAPAPFWIAHVEDAQGQRLRLPERPTPRRVMKKQVAEELRGMLVETTVRGTARRAFRLRSGRPLLQGVRVAGKTGSLSGTDPKGRYEWFVGVAPAEAPSIAIAVVTVHGDFFLQTSSQLAAEVLRRIFCPQGVCSEEAARAWLDRSPQPTPEVPPEKPAADS